MLLKWIVLLLFSASLTAGQSTRHRHRAQPSARSPLLASKARSGKGLSNLIKNLRAKGATVKPSSERVSQPFFSVRGRILIVNKEALQVFEFANAATAATETRQVGEGATTSAAWIAPPHFYHRGRLIVLYVGSDQSMLDLLTAVLGPPFAGS